MPDETASATAARARALDALLVAAARTGDQAAMARLAAHRGPRLLSHARKLADSADAARDIVQDAWVQIIRGLPGLADEAAFLPWALRIVTRRAARVVRGRVAARRLEAALDHDAVTLPAPVPETGLARAIATLPPPQRVVIGLFYTQDLTLDEIALALDIPVGTVKTRLFHARATLRAALRGDDDGQA
jgi:RNA polymerase sigma factor (sigma-70 family)